MTPPRTDQTLSEKTRAYLPLGLLWSLLAMVCFGTYRGTVWTTSVDVRLEAARDEIANLRKALAMSEHWGGIEMKRWAAQLQELNEGVIKVPQVITEQE